MARFFTYFYLSVWMLWHSSYNLEPNGMINKYLLDTNILVYYFNDEPEVQSIFDEIEAGDAEAFYCPISWVDLLCYPELTE